MNAFSGYMQGFIYVLKQVYYNEEINLCHKEAYYGHVKV